MPDLFVSFKEQNVRLGKSRWLFSGNTGLRFEWLAFLAIRRLAGAGQARVTVEEIAQLPKWAGRSRHVVISYMRRYIQSLDRQGLVLVRANAKCTGPFQLNVESAHISLDVSLAEAAKKLGIHTPQVLSGRELSLFILRYAHAQALSFQGRLANTRLRSALQKGAFDRFEKLFKQQSYGPRFRMMALLAAVHTQFQIGGYRRARSLLAGYGKLELLPVLDDDGLIARFWLAVAWSYQRASSGARSDRKTQGALRTAAKYIERTRDREVAGSFAYRNAGFLTKHGRHAEAVAELKKAIEAHLIIGNYYTVQGWCIDLGSDLHRLEREHYREARGWIVLGLAIGRWLGIGSDNAHGETILGKIYIEQGCTEIARWWLERAINVSKTANNAVSLADSQMMMALWHQEFGTSSDAAIFLIEALKIFRSLEHFDCAQKERYMARKFPEIWPDVLLAVPRSG